MSPRVRQYRATQEIRVVQEVRSLGGDVLEELSAFRATQKRRIRQEISDQVESLFFAKEWK